MAKIIMKMEKISMSLPACPTVLVGSMVDHQVDFVTVAWIGVASSSPPTIAIALQHQRHSLVGIHQNNAFSVNIPSIDLLKETDYCGLVSGANTHKANDCNFNVFYGKSKKAPFIEQCPINHACEIVQIFDLGSHELIIGRIIETFVNEECLTQGFIDPVKIKPFFFAGFSYFSLGDIVGDTYSSGSAIKPLEKKEKQ